MPEVQIVLNRIGKRCFVNCFERALQKTDSLTENDILECDPTVGREALDLRKSYIIRIFREEGHFTALNSLPLLWFLLFLEPIACSIPILMFWLC